MNAFFEYIVSEGLVKAIYLTLIHSLWQGALIAVIAGIIMVATKKASSAWRYNLLLSSLLLFVICAGYTFIKQSEHITENRQSLNLYSNTIVTENAAYNIAVQNTAKSITDEAVAFFNTNANAVVIFWFLVICFKCVQLLIGLSGTVNLRKDQIFPAGDNWENRLKELSNQLGIIQYIHLAQSGLAKVPLTVGYFKPVILIPLGLLAAMPQEQIEAILLHELAHIRRKDYLVNILQSLVEILFFFNPAIWWLSSLLRAERENCCDDLAVSKTSSKTDYIKALVAFEEYRGALPRYASAMSGSKNNLLNRAKRLIYNHNKTLNPMEKIILTCGLVITGMLTVAFTQVERHIVHKQPVISKIKPVQEMVNVRKARTVLDTTKKTTQNSSINTRIDGKMYRMVTKDGQITELYVDNVRVPDSKISDYKVVTDKIIVETEKSRIMAEKARLDAQQARLLAEDARRQAEKARVMAREQTKKVTQAGSIEKMKLAADDLTKQSEQVRIMSEKLKQEVTVVKLQSLEIEKNQVALSSEDAEKRSDKIKVQQENLNKQMEQINKQIQSIKEEAEKIRKSAVEDKKSIRTDYQSRENVYASQNIDIKTRKRLFEVPQRVQTVRPVAPIARDYVNSRVSYQPRADKLKNTYGEKVIQELIDQGIIKDKNVTFHITNEELVVDGVKQSDEARQKILSKIGINGSDRVDLTYSSTTGRSESK